MDRAERLVAKSDQLMGIAAVQEARAAELEGTGETRRAAEQRLFAATNRRYARAAEATLATL